MCKSVSGLVNIQCVGDGEIYHEGYTNITMCTQYASFTSESKPIQH